MTEPEGPGQDEAREIADEPTHVSGGSSAAPRDRGSSAGVQPPYWTSGRGVGASSIHDQGPEIRRAGPAWMVPVALLLLGFIVFAGVMLLMRHRQDSAQPTPTTQPSVTTASTVGPTSSAPRSSDSSTDATHGSASSGSGATATDTAADQTTAPAPQVSDDGASLSSSSAAPSDVVADFPPTARARCEEHDAKQMPVDYVRQDRQSQASCDFVVDTADQVRSMMATNPRSSFSLTVFSAYRASLPQYKDGNVTMQCTHDNHMSHCLAPSALVNLWIRDIS